MFDFITNGVLVSIQWQMKQSAYLVDDSNLEDETDEEELAVNIV